MSGHSANCPQSTQWVAAEEDEEDQETGEINIVIAEYLSLYLSISLSLYLSIYLPIYLSIYRKW